MQNVSKNSNPWLLIANGTAFPSQQLQKLAHNKMVMALDGAYQKIKKLGIKIDIVLGDFDSITPAGIREVNQDNSIKKILRFDQNKTDLEKGILYLDQNVHPQSIDIVAATGKKLHHTFYNLLLLKKLNQASRPLTIISSTEKIFYVENSVYQISGAIGDSISIFGFPEAIITTSGLKYDVQNFKLNFEQSASASNQLSQTEAMIKVTGPALIIQKRKL